jgi:large subunit ribosomal protein L21
MSTFAVIRTGGKQYRVETGMMLEVERLDGEAGAAIQLDDVLFVGNEGTFSIGMPLVKDIAVKAEIVEQKRGKKLIVFKKIRRHGKQWRKGHRQELTKIRITGIGAA